MEEVGWLGGGGWMLAGEKWGTRGGQRRCIRPLLLPESDVQGQVTGLDPGRSLEEKAGELMYNWSREGRWEQGGSLPAVRGRILGWRGRQLDQPVGRPAPHQCR